MQDLKGELYTMIKPHFKQGMLIKFKQGTPELSQIRVIKQEIIVKHNHDSLINIIPLISYVKTATRQAVTHI
jgi:hypothetical protein